MDRLDISKEELMACGDSLNDLEMIRLAGLGVAVGNAADEVKEQADHITAEHHRDGVAIAIEEFVL